MATSDPFRTELVKLTPRFEAGRDAHPNVWMLEAVYQLGSEAWTQRIVGVGRQGMYEEKETQLRPETYELYMTAVMMWDQHATSRPRLSFDAAVKSARHIVLRRSNQRPITPEIGKHNSWEQAIYLFGPKEDVAAFVAAAADAGALSNPADPCPPFHAQMERVALHSDPVSQWCARVHAAIAEARPECLWPSPPMRGGFQVRFLIDLDPWRASALTIQLLQAQTKAPAATASAATPPPVAPKDATAPPEQADPASRAIALMLAWDKEHRKYTVDDLALVVGLSRPALYRDPYFNAARKARKELGSAPSRGSKTADGDMEAWDT